MASPLDDVPELLGFGAKTGGGGGLGQILLIFFVFVVVIAIVAFISVYYVNSKKFKYKVIIWGRVSGDFEPIGKDRGKKIRIGTDGDYAFWIKKNKKLLPMPTIQTGRNTYYFYISDDQEWINFRLKDFDNTRREMGAQFLDKEMRYARTSLSHQGEQRYNKVGFWEKYGSTMAMLAVVLICAISMFFIMKEAGKVVSSLKPAIDSAKNVVEQSERLLSSIDSIMSGGSGYVEVGA